MANELKHFQQCPQCRWNFLTDEGQRGCSWGDCPFLPEDLNIFCDSCRFNFFTMEGNPPCGDPENCPHGTEPRARVEAIRRQMETEKDQTNQNK